MTSSYGWLICLFTTIDSCKKMILEEEGEHGVLESVLTFEEICKTTETTVGGFRCLIGSNHLGTLRVRFD